MASAFSHRFCRLSAFLERAGGSSVATVGGALVCSFVVVAVSAAVEGEVVSVDASMLSGWISCKVGYELQMGRW